MSSLPSFWERQPVAKLELEDLSTDPPTREGYFLLPEEILKFGRDKESNDHVIPSASLSRNHMEFYSISIEEGSEPMVYVRDRQSANGTFVNNILIGKGSEVTPGRLLEHGDTVTIKPNWRFKVELLAMKRTPLTALQIAETKLFDTQYTISDIILGSGASTTVRLGHDVKTGQQMACKIYDLRARREMGHEGSLELSRALTLMAQLDHPNISSFRRAYKSQHTLFVFEDLSAGGDLFSLVNSYIRLTELEIRWIMRQILVGLEYLHTMGIAHRDIKLENILLCICPNPAHRIALTDFGHAAAITKGRSFNSFVGTPGWQAPELFKEGRSHGLPIDMWSMGIMAVHLLLGRNKSETMARVESSLPANPNLETLDFKSIFHEIYIFRHECQSDDGPREDFIRRCLECDPAKRMTVDEALEHPYINEPARVRELFQLREEQTIESWTGRPVPADHTQTLPDVLAEPPAPPKAKKKATKPKLSIVIKKGTWKKDSEATTSPYFGKVTKPAGVKRARSDESTGDRSAKRRKVVVCLE